MSSFTSTSTMPVWDNASPPNSFYADGYYTQPAVRPIDDRPSILLRLGNLLSSTLSKMLGCCAKSGKQSESEARLIRSPTLDARLYSYGTITHPSHEPEHLGYHYEWIEGTSKPPVIFYIGSPETDSRPSSGFLSDGSAPNF